MKIWSKFWETKTVAESGIDEGSCGSARWDRGVNQIKLSGAQHSVTQRLVTLTRYHKNFCFPSISLTGQPGVKNLVEDRSRYISAVHYETNQLVREDRRKHFFCFSVESAGVNRLTQSKST